MAHNFHVERHLDLGLEYVGSQWWENSAGETLDVGDVVIYDVTDLTGKSATLTTTHGDPLVVGVVQTRAEDNKRVRVAHTGTITQVKVNGTTDIVAGTTYLKAYTEAGIAAASSGLDAAGTFALALEGYTDNDSLGVISAYLLPTLTRNTPGYLDSDAVLAVEAEATLDLTGVLTATSAVLTTPDLGTPSALVGTNITGTAAGLTAGNVTTNANLTGHVTSVGNAAVLGSFTKAQLNTAVSDGTPLYDGDITIYTDAEAISAVEGEATLALAGDVTIANLKSLSVNTINETTAGSGVTIDSVLLKDGLVDGIDVAARDHAKYTDAEAIAAVEGEATLVLSGVLTATSPVLTTPALGTPSALVATNATGTAAGLTAGNVTTNANLTGHITSVGNATVLGSFTQAQLMAALTDETIVVDADIGSSVQAWDANLDQIAALLPTDSSLMVGNGSAWVLESGATLRTSIGVDAAGTDNSTDVTLAGTPNYLTIAGQEITLGLIDLATDVTGELPETDGGTGLSAYTTGDILYATGANTLGVLAVGSNTDVLTLAGGVPTWAAQGAPGAHAASHQNGGADEISVTGLSGLLADDQHVLDSEVTAVIDADIGVGLQAWDANLDQIAALAVTDGNFIVGNGSAWVAESGATARTSLGLGSLATLSTVNNGNWSGTDLSVANGGTGASTLTDHGVVLGSGTGAVSVTSAGTSGQVLTSNGAAADPTFQAAGGSDIQEFTSSGTWTKPSSGSTVLVEIYSSGGGGAGGSRESSGVTSYGGGSGASGYYQAMHFDISDLGATETVTIGSGGSGGAGAASDSTDGSNGSDGGATTFGSWLKGWGGGGGTGAFGQGGSASAGSILSNFHLGTKGVSGRNTNSSNKPSLAQSGQGGGGGGAGGTVSSGNVAQDGGDSGGRNNYLSDKTGSAITSITAKTGGSASGGAGVNGTTFGDGGSGGAAHASGTAGAGGNGAIGGGGGGGGGARNGNTAGAGGDGGDGFMRVTTW
jgi:hypothetical protein